MSSRSLEPGIHQDLTADESYAGYLRLDLILAAQQPRSEPPHHDETLFIIQHQTSELWMKLMLHELTAVVEGIKRDELEPAFKRLARVGRIQEILFQQWSVLETLTPNEYLEFRGALGRASGFQSHQFRAIEFVLGNKDEHALKPFAKHPKIQSWLRGLLEAPSLYDEFLLHLHREGHPIPAHRVERDWTRPAEADAEVRGAFGRIYQTPERYWDAYEMAEKLIDVEERFQLWRFRHIKTVARVIGFKGGTGGSSGVPFLIKGLEQQLFPELWDVRTDLMAPSPPSGPERS